MNEDPENRTRQVVAESAGFEARELAKYQTVSGSAVTALILGVASPICYLGSILLVVPLAAAAAAAIAFRRISASDGALIGRPAATLGLLLAIASGTSLFGFEATQKALRVGQARQRGRQWIELMLQGKQRQAYRLACGADPPDPSAPPAEGPPVDAFKTFLGQPAAKELLAAGADAEVQGGDVNFYLALRRGEFHVQLLYTITPRGSGAAGSLDRTPFVVQLFLSRTRYTGDALANWYLSKAELVDESNAEAGP